jgi:hypothetical protein
MCFVRTKGIIMTTENSIEINHILTKLGLSEDEVGVLMAHFVEKHIKENCQLSLSMDLDTDYEGENRYVKINYKVQLFHKDEVILFSEDYTSACIS